VQIFTLIVTTFGVLYGIVFTGQIASDFLLIIPFIFLIIGSQFKFNEINMRIAYNFWDKYELDEGFSDHVKNHTSQLDITIFDVIPKWLMYIGIPMGIAVIYSFFIVFHRLPLVTYLPSFFHVILMVFFSLFIIFSGAYYILYNRIYKLHFFRELCKRIS